MPQFTPEQVEDIKSREAKALEMLRELQLTPAVQVQAVNIGDDCFAFKPVPFLNDTKYTSQVSSIQAKDLPPEKTTA